MRATGIIQLVCYPLTRCNRDNKEEMCKGFQKTMEQIKIVYTMDLTVVYTDPPFILRIIEGTVMTDSPECTFA